MLTRKHLTRAVQLMHDYGELRAGTLEHEAADFAGPSYEPYVPLARNSSQTDDAQRHSISFHHDEKSGRLIFVQR